MKKQSGKIVKREDGTIESATISMINEKATGELTWDPEAYKKADLSELIVLCVLEMADVNATESSMTFGRIGILAGVDLEINLKFKDQEEALDRAKRLMGKDLLREVSDS